ncbi:hypothetical protein [Georgenia sp. SUBG003]|uniref:hypothetical protein n=1 Tax=Georgenia sp. SUBG003 TaxID=1497974 RepID=UPI003AB1978C
MPSRATPRATAVHVEALDALVTRYHGQGPVPLPGPVVARRRCGRLTLAPGRRGPDGPDHPDDPGAPVGPART